MVSQIVKKQAKDFTIWDVLSFINMSLGILILKIQ